MITMDDEPVDPPDGQIYVRKGLFGPLYCASCSVQQSQDHHPRCRIFPTVPTGTQPSPVERVATPAPQD